ncbi:PDDEXK nuclease domain-containing protein [Raoultibacter phocaeensis]|uniref:PDDEXK nuclease domain-containing protein n=1 Tax=Raoultibacter phocaeensis TaxID=2479841 RepID=UPI001118D5A0|nr:PDDEXK nuclease domain-containing protein [Raoultibacter phocaeensis]
MLANSDEYMELLASVKSEIAESRHRAVLKANAELVSMYWRIGRSINDHAQWGSKFIETLSKDVRMSFPGTKGFSVRNLKYMAKFAREIDFEFVQQAVAQIPWGHITCILDKTISGAQRNWYIEATIRNGWSRAVLTHQIEGDLYGRQVLAEKVTNFGKRLPSPESDLAEKAMKDPYIFDFITQRETMAERMIEDQMVKNIQALLLELGTGFAFMGNQYHLSVAGQDFYIDLLFYNVKLKSYVVIELKAGSFKPEYAGKLNFYLSAVDDLLRNEGDSPSIGLLLCGEKDNAIAEYSLRDMDKPIGVSEYRLTGTLPKDVASVLPSPEDLLKRIASV